MPRGLPDYYNPDTLVSQRLANVEEIVTAIREITCLDNRGRTLYNTMFNSAINRWELEKTGDGEYPVVSADQALVEPASMKMDAGTATGSGTSAVVKRIMIEGIKKAGLEIGLYWKTGIGDLHVQFSFDDGALIHIAYLVIDRDNKIIRLLTPTGWETAYDLAYVSALSHWLVIKVVADFENHNYERLLVGLDQTDLTAYTLLTQAHSFTGSLRVWLSAQPPDDGSCISYVGLASITIDEP